LAEQAAKAHPDAPCTCCLCIGKSQLRNGLEVARLVENNDVLAQWAVLHPFDTPVGLMCWSCCLADLVSGPDFALQVQEYIARNVSLIFTLYPSLAPSEMS